MQNNFYYTINRLVIGPPFYYLVGVSKVGVALFGDENGILVIRDVNDGEGVLVVTEADLVLEVCSVGSSVK